MKKYTVINNEKNQKYHYSNFSWNLSWWSVFGMGVMFGAYMAHHFIK